MFIASGTGFFQVIECVQAPFLLCDVVMQIVAIVLVLIIPVLHHGVVELEVGEILVDIVNAPLLMAVGGVVAGLVECMMALDMGLDHSEVKV